MKRFKEDLVELSRFGRSDGKRIRSYEDLEPEVGVTRVAGSEPNMKARDYVVEKMNEIGLDVRVDKVGNIFGRFPGTDSNKETLMAGSHIDSVKNGGMFDGALGVINALEAVRRLNDDDFENTRPIEVVVLTGEEGSAFPTGLLGSSFLIGDLSLEDAYELRNENEETLERTLEIIGYKGDFEYDLSNVEYFIESHVEQGPILESEETSIGVVDRITGISWVSASIKGVEDHAGTTPMDMRKDPLVAASEVVKFVNNEAKELSKNDESSLVATVGKLNVYPNSPNIIPAKVELGIDIRDIKEKFMNNMLDKTKEKILDLKGKHGVETEFEELFNHSGSDLSDEVSKTIHESGYDLDIGTKKMSSGACHDAQNLAKKVKTGLIFLPSVDGVSHAPMEWTNWSDIEKGIKVLTETIKKLTNK